MAAEQGNRHAQCYHVAGHNSRPGVGAPANHCLSAGILDDAKLRQHVDIVCIVCLGLGDGDTIRRGLGREIGFTVCTEPGGVSDDTDLGDVL